jgi:hypothetical protein
MRAPSLDRLEAKDLFSISRGERSKERMSVVVFRVMSREDTIKSAI